MQRCSGKKKRWVNYKFWWTMMWSPGKVGHRLPVFVYLLMTLLNREGSTLSLFIHLNLSITCPSKKKLLVLDFYFVCVNLF